MLNGSKINKIALVVPNYAEKIANVAQTTVGPPLGLAYMAKILLQRNFNVFILDANAERLSEQKTAERLMKLSPDVIGFTATTPTIELCAKIAELVRSAFPSALIVFGGPHPTMVPEESLRKYAVIDLIVRGEADVRFADILEGLVKGKSFSDFDGLAFRKNDDEVVLTSYPASLVELDSLPLPARELLPMHRYISPDGGNFTTIIGTRGCPCRCIYCNVPQIFGYKLRARAPEKVVEEMLDCSERFKTKVFGFIDDTFAADKKWALSLCEKIVNTGLAKKVRWSCLTRVDTVDKNLLLAMRKAGCFRVEFGIESGDKMVLDFLNKGISVQQVIEAHKLAREAGLETMAFVMLFSPPETEQTLEATKKLVFQADPDILQVSFCTPYPGTPLENFCKKSGIKVSDNYSEFVFLATPVIEHPLFSMAQMLLWQKRFLRSFYLRPKTIFRLIRSTIKKGAWRGFIRSGISGLKSLLKRRT